MLYIYIVSLKQDVEKRKVISKNLENFGLRFSFIDAVYGKELSDNIVTSIRAKSAGAIHARQFPLTHGEIGCTLSHLKAYQAILDNNLEWACILEDDAILDERFETFISTFQATGLNPESLYLLGGQNGLGEGQIIKSIKNIKTVGGQKFTKTIKSEAVIYRACCYLMSLPLAKKMIDLAQTNFILADDWSYLVKNDIIKKIYLSDFVDHPLDLSESHLQAEREQGKIGRAIKKNSLTKRLRNIIKRRIKFSILTVYKYLEIKDRI